MAVQTVIKTKNKRARFLLWSFVCLLSGVVIALGAVAGLWYNVVVPGLGDDSATSYEFSPATPAAIPAVDIMLQVSEDYINRDIKEQLSRSPISHFGVQVKAVSINFDQPNRVRVFCQLTFLGVTNSFSFEEQISVNNSKVDIHVVKNNQGVPGISQTVKNGIIGLINIFMEKKINEKLATLTTNLEKNSTTVSRVPTLIGIKTEPGKLTGEFIIKVD